MAGRHTSLTDELRDAAIKLAGLGLPMEVIADRCRVSPSTMRKWVNQWGNPDWEPVEGQHCPDDREPYTAFAAAYREAQAQPIMMAEGTWLKAIRGAPATYDKDGRMLTPAIPADWKAGERWLKLHRPDLYKETVEVDLAGELGKSVEMWAKSIEAMIDKAQADDDGPETA